MCFSCRSRICTGYFSYDRFSWTCIGSGLTMCEGSGMYFRNCDAQNTLCTIGSSSDSSNRYATSSTLYMIGYDPMYLGLSFPAIPNLLTPLVGKTQRNTLSPTWNSRADAFGRRSCSGGSRWLSFVSGSLLFYPWWLGLVPTL